ncbi:metal-sensitive transcriptional regulator [Homoserinibacter sp. GY 40078]|uniref:metal-sensitive transcriptional regulator n=1 Tax=Homoserinibacter sp. GY 40078 TaxID=2603275 RepID=UPI0011C81714|nr:metal-sensitive transcriptional regulator [Homoserinibacter sp. GY 40078]TXK19659.1 metal-sensitive transcriptional regulator [Homoserinibacter sp. GY 40078]
MSTMTDESERRAIANRLKRAEGQLRALISAVERGDDCRAIVTQLSAVSSALDRAGFAIVAGAMRDCVVRDGSGEPVEGELTVGELEKLFLTLA